MKNSWTTADIPPQNNKLALVTGANSGIGWHTALELARAGAEVILAARTQAKGAAAIARIRQCLPQARVRAEILDLADLSSVRALAGRLNARPKLDLLINNAGVMAIPRRETTANGFERQFGTNYLGPFALTALVFPALLRAPEPRITFVSSGAASMGLRRIQFEDLQWEKNYSPWKAYCQSKLADLLLAQELSRRCARAKIPLLVTAAHPGYARTNLQTSGPGRSLGNPFRLGALLFFMSQDAAHGALPTLRAATAPAAASGSYFGPSRMFGLKGSPVLIPVPPPALDQSAACQLWDVSEPLTGVSWKIGG